MGVPSTGDGVKPEEPDPRSAPAKLETSSDMDQKDAEKQKDKEKVDKEVPPETCSYFKLLRYGSPAKHSMVAIGHAMVHGLYCMQLCKMKRSG